MNFDIDNKVRKNKKQKSQDKKLVFASLFFFMLSIIFSVIYIITPTYRYQAIEPPKEKKVEPKLKIVNENSNQRPIAIMIDNNVGEIEHAGLQDSFINYEIIVEGGLTRIMALYKDENPVLVGPIRSARHYFIDYALEYDAVFTHYGWSTYAERDINLYQVNNINGMEDDSIFERDENIQTPHNVFTQTNKIRDYFSVKGYSSTSTKWRNIKYSISPIYLNNINIQNNDNSNNTDIKKASKVSIEYSRNENRAYVYDSVNEYYLRSQNGTAHIDKNTQRQLHYKNVIIQIVNNNTIDDEDRQELQDVGTGEAIFITNGYSIPIYWKKTGRNTKTIYTYSNGGELVLNDGNTFVQIVPDKKNIKINS